MKTLQAARVVIFEDPNEACKPTHGDAVLAVLGIHTFSNADCITRSLSARNMDGVAFKAGRIMLKRLRQLGDVKADFAFECAQLAVRRVKLRVALGGHDVPGDVVRRRFGRSLSNFFMLCAPLADEWTLFDNSETKRRAR